MSFLKKQIFIFCCWVSFLSLSAHAETVVYGLHTANLSSDAHPPYLIQLGAFQTQHSAKSLKERSENVTCQVYIKKSSGFFTVIAGPFHDLKSLYACEKRLRKPDNHQHPTIFLPHAQRISSSQDSRRRVDSKRTNSSLFYHPYVMTLSVGPVWESAGETQTSFLRPTTIDAFQGESPKSVSGVSVRCARSVSY